MGQALKKVIAAGLIGVISIQSGVSLVWAENGVQEDILKEMFRRERYTKAPGTVGGLMSQGDLKSVVEYFRGFVATSEAALAAMSEDDIDGRTAVVFEYVAKMQEMAQLLAVYWRNRGEVKTLVQLRSWSESLGLRVPKNIRDEVPGLVAGTRDKSGSRFNVLVIEEKGDGAIIRPNENFLAGLRLASTLDVPGKDSFNTIIKYLAIRQLYQNLGELRLLSRGERNDEMPALPEEIQRNLEGVDVRALIGDDYASRLIEPAVRAEIISVLGSAAGQLPGFSTASEVRALAMVFGEMVGGLEALVQAVEIELRSYFAKVEDQGILKVALANSVNSASWNFAALSRSSRVEVLRHLVARACGDLQRSVLSQLRNRMRARGSDLNGDQERRILRLVREREKEFADNIPDGVLERAATVDSSMIVARIALDQRQALIAGLQTGARQMNSEMALLNGSIDLRAVRLANMGEINAQSLRQETTGAWLEEVVAFGVDYDGGAKRYHEILERESNRKERGRVFRDSEFGIKAQTFLEGPHRDDLKDWITVGKVFGFDKDFSGYRRAVSSLDVISAEKIGLYREIRRGLVRNEFPLLSATVEWDGREVQVYEAVKDATESGQLSVLADLGLKALETQIKINIEKVARAKDLSDISVIVDGSMMTQMVGGFFPEFKPELRDFAKQIRTKGFTDQFMDTLVRPYINYVGGAFIATLLLHGAKWGVKKVARPYAMVFEPFLWTVEPFLAGYSSWFWPAIVADIGLQGRDVYVGSRKANESREWFFSRAQGLSFLQQAESDAVELEFEQTKSEFMTNVFLTGVFVGAGVFSVKVTAPRVSRVTTEFAQDLLSFKGLGLPPGTWDAMKIEQAYFAKTKGVVMERERALLKQCRDWLIGEIGAGKRWDAQRLQQLKPVTKREKEIIRAMDQYFEMQRRAEVIGKTGGTANEK